MLSLLVTSAARRKLLVRFMTHPGERFYLTQLIRDLEITSSAAQKELARLTKSGLLLTEREGNLRFYSVNTAHPMYSELKSIVYKTEGLGSVLTEGLRQVADTAVALIYGSVARGTEDAASDVDLLVIGDVEPAALDAVLLHAERLLDRDVNATVLTVAEWRDRVERRQAFALDVLSGPKIFLIGDEDGLR
jgi:predicted nucleotidyltransferase